MTVPEHDLTPTQLMPRIRDDGPVAAASDRREHPAPSPLDSGPEDPRFEEASDAALTSELTAALHDVNALSWPELVDLLRRTYTAWDRDRQQLARLGDLWTEPGWQEATRNYLRARRAETERDALRKTASILREHLQGMAAALGSLPDFDSCPGCGQKSDHLDGCAAREEDDAALAESRLAETDAALNTALTQRDTALRALEHILRNQLGVTDAVDTVHRIMASGVENLNEELVWSGAERRLIDSAEQLNELPVRTVIRDLVDDAVGEIHPGFLGNGKEIRWVGGGRGTQMPVVGEVQVEVLWQPTPEKEDR